MNHVQAVTVLESSYPDSSQKNSVTVKRHVLKDNNNNQQQITKESLNATTTTTPSVESDEPEEYTLLGLVTFKSPIKWMNSISIILIHLIFIYGFITYPLYAQYMTTAWGEQCLAFRTRKIFHHSQSTIVTKPVFQLFKNANLAFLKN